MSKLRAIGRSIHDPAVAHAFLAAMTVLGAWTVLEGLATQARETGRKLAIVQTQARATLQDLEAAQQAAQANGAAAAAWATTPHQHLDDDVAPDQPPVDVAGEHEDLHP